MESPIPTSTTGLVILDDVVEGIMLKLPAKSLTRFKSASKFWRDLINHPYFIKAHLQNNRNNSSIVSLKRESGAIVMLDKKVGHDHQFIVKERPPMPWNYDPDRYEVQFECSCDGILCVTKRPIVNIGEKIQVALWNPNIRRHKTIFVRNHYTVQFGFGYDSTINDYKFVKLIRMGFSYEVDVLKVKSNQRSQASYNLPYHIKYSPTPVSLNGAVHWLGKKEDETETIVRFDLGSETFRELPLPVADGKQLVASITERKGKLCVGTISVASVCLRSRCSDIWVMEDESWIKLFTISPIDPFARFCSIDESALIEGDTFRTGYDDPLKCTFYLDNAKFKMNDGINVTIAASWEFIIVCADSLVRLV